jgi:hypothetical protein
MQRKGLAVLLISRNTHMWWERFSAHKAEPSQSEARWIPWQSHLKNIKMEIGFKFNELIVKLWPVGGGCRSIPSSLSMHSMAFVFFSPTLSGSFILWERRDTPLDRISGHRIPFWKKHTGTVFFFTLLSTGTMFPNRKSSLSSNKKRL